MGEKCLPRLSSAQLRARDSRGDHWTGGAACSAALRGSEPPRGGASSPDDWGVRSVRAGVPDTSLTPAEWQPYAQSPDEREHSSSLVSPVQSSLFSSRWSDERLLRDAHTAQLMPYVVHNNSLGTCTAWAFARIQIDALQRLLDNTTTSLRCRRFAVMTSQHRIISRSEVFGFWFFHDFSYEIQTSFKEVGGAPWT